MIRYTKDIDDIATLTLDMSGRSVNVINHEIFEAFVPVIKHLKEEKKRSALRGVILTSRKKSFLAGGDLEYLYRADDPGEIFQFAQRMQKFFRDIESPGVPVVAAINGDALGAGFELALACHHRIAIDRASTKLGLPEISLGLIPGGGGIVRLMWLLGLEEAYHILTGGKQYAPRQGLSVGIIDELAQNGREMMDKAKSWILETGEGRRPWDRSDGRIPGGTAREVALARRIRRLSAELSSQTHNNYPAQQAVLNVLTEGSKVDFDTACRIESRYYATLVCSQACKNMIKTFWFDENDIKKGKTRPAGFGKFRPGKVGVIGAGLMGSGIAFACLMNGLEVVLKDVSQLIAERGREFVRKRLEMEIDRGNIGPERRDALLENISTTENSEEFATCDLVIEAVFENQMVKQKVMREAEEHMDEYALFATNTISIPITELAKASVRPENYVGLHFFHPAEEVPLVEIVRGAQTTEESIARAFDFSKAIRKIPIIVKDDWGFFAGRVHNTYLLEGITMLQEGYPAALIENLGKQAGMPSGPLLLADELGLDIVQRYENQAAEHYGPKYIQHPAVSVLETMLDQLSRTGRAQKAGFYRYEGGEPRGLWEGLEEHFPPEEKEREEFEEIIQRFLFAQVIEAVWCLQEGVIDSVSEANLGSVYGWGFPAFKGGVIQYVSDVGPEAFITRCNDFKERHGQRFRIPSKLRHFIEKG